MRLRILHKMLLGYALYLAIAFSFGIYVYGQVGQIMAKQRLVEIADDSKEKLLELRRNEKNYIMRKNPVYLDKIHEIMPKFKDLIAGFRPDMVSALSASDHKVLIDSLKNYSGLLERFSSNHRETTALTAKLSEIGRRIEQKTVNTSNYELTRDILEIRLVEKNYILFMEKDYFHELNHKVLALQKAFPGEPDCSSLCAAYLETARNLFEHNKKEAALLPQIRDAANRMEQIITKVAKRERENIAGYVVKSQRLLLGALLALAFFGSLLTWFLSKAISAPLQKLEATVRRITQGDFDLRLDTKGDLETVSLQKSFNTMLDTLELARESLAKTVQLLQEKSIQLIESEKLASIGILASGVAHEINNPLANISVTAETVLEAVAENPDPEELTELITDIISQTERASAVVDNLLGYARSMKDARIVDEDVRAILRQSVALVAHEIKLHDIALRQSLPEAALPVRVNRGKLEQVFVNIMLNAVQAMDHNGTLSLLAKPDATGRFAVIEVRDTGPGIAEENLKNIFDPFFTTKAAGDGTGLGLYVSHGIVLEHGGDIEVESSARQGTLFRIRLPLAAPRQEDAPI